MKDNQCHSVCARWRSSTFFSSTQPSVLSFSRRLVREMILSRFVVEELLTSKRFSECRSCELPRFSTMISTVEEPHFFSSQGQKRRASLRNLKLAHLSFSRLFHLVSHVMFRCYFRNPYSSVFLVLIENVFSCFRAY